MAAVAENLGTEVTIVGRRKGNCCSGQPSTFRTKRFRLIFNKGFLFYASINLRLLFYLLSRKADLIVSNDLDTLLPCYIASKLKRVQIVYDSHEYFTGLPELNGRKFVKGFWTLIERAIVPRLENCITVSDPIADIFLKAYNRKFTVLRNCSVSAKGIVPVERESLGAGGDKLLLVIQGSGINIDKGAEELVEAMKGLSNAVLIIIGSGDVIEDLKIIVKKAMIGDRVRFLPLMPWAEMMRYTKAADAGFCLEKDTNINYRFSLPNKLFDYISAGIPVIAGNLPLISSVLAEHSCGIIIPEITPGEIIKAVELLDRNRDLLAVLRKNSEGASVELNWDNESVKVKELYLNLLAQIG